MKCKIILITLFSYLTMASLFSISVRDTENNSTFVKRYDAFGNEMGKGALGLDFENYDNVTSGGFSYLYRYKIGEMFLINTTAPGTGISYNMAIGDNLVLVNYPSYLFQRSDLSGIVAGVDYNKWIKFDLLYSRFNDFVTEESLVLDSANRYGSTYNDIADYRPFAGSEDLSVSKIHEELWIAQFSLKPRNSNLPFLKKRRESIPVEALNFTTAVVKSRSVEAGDKNTMQGYETTTDIPTWYIQVSVPSAEETDGEKNAHVYSISVNGERSFVTPNPVAIPDTISAGNPAVYAVRLGTSTNQKKFKVEMLVDNSYIIQLSSTGSFDELVSGAPFPADVVAVSKGAFASGINKTNVVFYLGSPASKILTGLSVSGTIGDFTYMFEGVINNAYKRLPSQGASFVRDTTKSLLFRFELPLISKIMLGGTFYFIDPLYNTSFGGYSLVSDNDDGDNYSGENEPTGNEIPQIADKNNNGILDWKDNWLIVKTTPLVFDGDHDFNHNNRIDKAEDDVVPDYPYSVDIKGLRLSQKFSLFKSVSFTLGQIYETKITKGTRNLDLYLQLEMQISESSFGKFSVQDSIHYIEDNVANHNSDSLTGANILISGLDDLLYKKFVRNRLLMKHRFDKISTKYYKLSIENNLFSDFNYSIDARMNFHNFSVFSKLHNTLTLGKYLELNAYGILLKENSQNSKIIRKYLQEETSLYGIVFAKLTPAHESWLEGGFQYLYNIDNIEIGNNFERKSFVVQLLTKQRRGLAIFGAEVSRQTPLMGSETSYKEETRVFARVVL